MLLCSKAAKLEYDGQIALSDAVESGFPYYPLFFYYYLNNTSGTLFLGEMEDLSDAREYPLAEEENYIIIDNLKVDTTYYYEIHAANAVYPGTFRTAPSTRFLYIPGLANVRDIGGGRNLDGKKVRQGLLIRGVELDGLVNAKYYIPEDKLAGVQETSASATILTCAAVLSTTARIPPAWAWNTNSTMHQCTAVSSAKPITKT